MLFGLALGQAGAAIAQPDSARGGPESASAPTIDRDRADRLVPSIQQAPQSPAPAGPAPSVAITPVQQSANAVALTQVRYEGATLAAATLDRAVAAYLGKALTQETLQSVANAIAGAYASSDIAFYSVSIPAQTPAGGVLTVKVVEGRVTDYQLAGASKSTPTRLIRAHMRRLMGETPLHKKTLERTLSLLRDVPGQTLDVNVRQLAAPGDLALDLTVKRKQLQIGIVIDNSGVSNVIQGVQAQASVTINGLAREGDSLRVSGYLPFYPDRYQFYSLGYTTPIGSDGLTLGGSFATMKTRSSNQISGAAKQAGVALSYPLIRSYKANVSINASLDGIDSSNYFLDTQFGDYRSRAVRLGGSYSRSDEKYGFAVSATVSQGVDLFNAKAFAGYSGKSFTKANIQGVVVKNLKKNLTVRTDLRAQYSQDMLPVTERASLGGRGAGMAFPVGTATAEKVAAGSIQLDFKLPASSPALKNASLFVYLDGSAGRTVARPAYALPTQSVSMASAGVGVRVAVGKGWSTSVEVAVPLERPDSAYSNKARIFFGVSRTI